MTATTTETLAAETILQWMKRNAEIFREHKDELTDLDAAIGDADHGANMARGFTALEGKLPELAGKDIGTIFKTVAMTLISTVGGASGPLYGTFFLQAVALTSGKKALTAQELYEAFASGLEGLKNRGKAHLGDKTMLDAMIPAIDALKPQPDEGIHPCVERALAAARQGAEATIPLVAKKGRASYLGERSAGHKDPGATSTVLLWENLLHVLTPAA